jgi:hypothetical protein
MELAKPREVQEKYVGKRKLHVKNDTGQNFRGFIHYEVLGTSDSTTLDPSTKRRMFMEISRQMSTRYWSTES